MMNIGMGTLSILIDRLRSVWNMIQYPSSPQMGLAVMGLMAGLAAFGLLNVFLGFRLMRFWMMLGSLGIGMGIGAVLGWWLQLDIRYMLGIGLGIGAILAILSFFVYNWGVFVVGLIGGFAGGIYLVHPTSSLSFFLCAIAGVIIGVLGMKFSRVILIIATSVLGGVLAGFAIAWLGKFDQIPGPMGIPIGVLMGFGISFLGIIVQIIMNPFDPDEDDDEDEEYDDEEYDYREHDKYDKFRRKNNLNEEDYEEQYEKALEQEADFPLREKNDQDNTKEGREAEDRKKKKKRTVHRDDFGRKYIE